jgi:folate-dependent phosphoribosylglycinamide formyltransferase PurN
MYRLGWFSTGRGPGSRGLLAAVNDAIRRGEINAKIDFVFCSREAGEAEGSDEFLRLVESYNLPLVPVSYQKFRKAHVRHLADKTDKNALPEWRLEYDRTIMAKLEKYNPDLCVLAGYMLVVGREMCARYTLLNLHPAAPWGPKGTWQEVIWQLIESKANETGVMMHLVTPALDRGPVVTYCAFPIRGSEFDKPWSEIEGKSVTEIKAKEGEENALFKLIRAEGVKREIPLIIAIIKAFSESRVKVVNGKVYDESGEEVSGYNLTEDIDKMAGRKS